MRRKIKLKTGMKLKIIALPNSYGYMIGKERGNLHIGMILEVGVHLMSKQIYIQGSTNNLFFTGLINNNWIKSKHVALLVLEAKVGGE